MRDDITILNRQIPSAIISALKAGHDYRCFYCGNETMPTRIDYAMESFPEEATIDHKIPVSRGGDHSLSNLVIACRRCNCRKGPKTMDEYRYYLRYMQTPLGRKLGFLYQSLSTLEGPEDWAIKMIIRDLERRIPPTVFYGETQGEVSR